MKALLKQVQGVAAHLAPRLAFDDALTRWAALHGWAPDADGAALVARQAVLEAIAREVVPGLVAHAFPTPLPSVGLPDGLVRAFGDAARRREVEPFNFWGALYTRAIPQKSRRQLGQFWTSAEVADWMTGWLLEGEPSTLLDVGCGAGNFLLSARGRTESVSLSGLDVSPHALNLATAAHLDRGRPVPALFTCDFLRKPLPRGAEAVVCNPPYTRHHDIAPDTKDAMQAFFRIRLRLDVSRQGTLALFFLLKLIAEMQEGVRAAVIAPMEVVDARYGQAARVALLRYTALDAMIHFAPQMSAFHKVDVGATILLFTKGGVPQPIRHLTLHKLPDTASLLDALRERAPRDLPFGRLEMQSPEELVGVRKWFHIARNGVPTVPEGRAVVLGTLAKVMRGIATGANDFFALSNDEVRLRRLEPYVVRTLQRNREARGLVFGPDEWAALRTEGRRVWLLYLNRTELDAPALRAYVAEGEREGYHRRSLVRTRRAWYLMEQREVPSLFFTILTRGNPRFIWNAAGVRPLNMFSCVYPHRSVQEAGLAEALWALLNSTFCRERLAQVSRTYGGNTLKVEPRELDQLPVPDLLRMSRPLREQLQTLARRLTTAPYDEVGWDQVDALVARAIRDGERQIGRLPGVQLRLLDPEAPYTTAS